MFTTLVGTNTGDTEHRTLFERLCAITRERGFVSPDTAVPIRPDGPLEGWSLEQRGTRDQAADFVLAVNAPSCAGRLPGVPCLQDDLWATHRCGRVGVHIRFVPRGPARCLGGESSGLSRRVIQRIPGWPSAEKMNRCDDVARCTAGERPNT